LVSRVLQFSISSNTNWQTKFQRNYIFNLRSC
jgi:hypothetical protein